MYRGPMPHVIVKMYEGRTAAQKRGLADAITQDVVAVAGCLERSVSVAIEEFSRDEWAEAVYRPDILESEGTLVRRPGYNPFE